MAEDISAEECAALQQQVELLKLEFVGKLLAVAERIADALEAQVVIGNETLERIKAIN